MFRATFVLLGFTAAIMAAEPSPQRKPNRLVRESSPYLLQHAHNPVDWYPWGAEAFTRAKKEGKLVFLSIGYSSCHWCHVMERESFENPAIAAILNEHFICIKVDREERPDIDDVYMTALQEVLGLSGGWPLSLFLTAEGKPIFGGTYWPPDDRKVGEDTIDGFKTVLKRVVDLNKSKSKELAAQADKVAELTSEAMSRGARLALGVKLDGGTVKAATEAFDIDPVHGGFGFKPAGYQGTKFPRVAAQWFLLNQSRKPGNEHLAKLMTVTLEKMAAGGIFDQVGGGFHRYSTERTWTVPHFEKMLYDNAQLLELYAEAYHHDPKPDYRRVVQQTTAFLAREMTSPEGAFYSALDADSEGEEGAYYVWTVKDLSAAIPDSGVRRLVADAFGITTPNFEEKYAIPTRRVLPAELAGKYALTASQIEDKLGTARELMFAARTQRRMPFRDEKILAGWNGLMIAGYARSGEVFRDRRAIHAAEQAADFVLTKMRTDDERLLRVYAAKPGERPEARITAALEDYAYMVHGLLNLYDATGQEKWRSAAQQLTDQMVRHHGDAEHGGFFTTPHDGEKLFARGKDYYDGATPSGNGLAARNLIRLWSITKNNAFRNEAERVVQLYGGVLRDRPTAVPLLADTLDRILATGMLSPSTSTNTPKPAAKPKHTEDVVTISATAGKARDDGEQPFTVVVNISKAWHIYANPVENADLLPSTTRVEVLVDGHVVPASLEYPPGRLAKDTGAGEYRVYEGTVKITGRLQRNAAKGPLEVRVSVTACDDKTCLLPSVLKTKVR